MQKLQFFNLPRPIQERFIESTRGNGLPKPLLYREPASNPRIVLLGVFASVLFIVCAFGARIGFGRLEHPWAVQPPLLIVGYGAALAIACSSLTAAVRLWNREANVPFRRGTYVFPVGVIDAKSAVLDLHSLQNLEDISVNEKRVCIRFSTGAVYEFVTSDSETATRIEAVIVEAHQQLKAPASERSKREQALMDPLFDTGYKNPFSPHESMRPLAISQSWRWFLLATIIGAAAGAGLWQWRNWLSEQTMYRRARAVDTPAAYKSYLARGGKREEVRELFLPKSELREARALGSVDAIERYLSTHPNSRILREIETSLRDALLLELGEVSRAGSLSKLRAFRNGDPHLELIRPELKAAEQNVCQALLAKFQSASKNSPDLVSFFEKLVRYAAEHGPKVEVRFRRRIPPSFEKADAQVRKSPFCKDSSVPPGQYFNNQHVTKREAAIVTAISQRFADVFPKEVLSFEAAAPVPDDGTPIATVSVPTLLITYRTELSPPFTSLKPKGVYVGLGFLFKSVLMIPGGSTTRTFDSSTWSPPNLKKLEAENWGPAELYEFMAQEAFDQFSKRWLQSVFRSPN